MESFVLLLGRRSVVRGCGVFSPSSVFLFFHDAIDDTTADIPVSSLLSFVRVRVLRTDVDDIASYMSIHPQASFPISKTTKSENAKRPQIKKSD